MDALHPKRDVSQPEQKSPAIADGKKQATPISGSEETEPCGDGSSSHQSHQKVKMVDVNSSLTCELCKGYLIDATTISECLHSFCRSCIIKFLQENSFCPVCEVIINKAKPNLKLDKTLQDIVYKLVPGLFLSEMLRRRRFYADKPLEAGRTSPEQRGDDTERTIFNPQDRISLSLEYIGDAATTGLILKDLKQKHEVSEDVPAESLLKRYLQCPAMCRIDVIKKFIRNKYNVNTDLFQIDILYKRVPLPLPDHYTLIDVAYIYTWKRNEPMRFYFRIIDKGNDELPDLTKVFTPAEDAPLLPKPIALSTPNRAAKAKEKNRKTPRRSASKKLPTARQKTAPKEDEIRDDKEIDDDDTGKRRYVSESEPEGSPKKCSDVKVAKTETEDAGSKKETEVARELSDNKVYTNITLDRSNNLEIVTRIQKLADKDSKQIEVNVIGQSAKPNEDKCGDGRATLEKPPGALETKSAVETANASVTLEEATSSKPNETKDEPADPKREPPAGHHSPSPEVSSTTTENDELERTKFEFLKSIELTAKKVVDNIARMVQEQQKQSDRSAEEAKPSDLAKTDDAKPSKPSSSHEGNGLKRKNPSPIKIEPKKAKVETKRTTKIILQQKPGYPPLNLLKQAETVRPPGELMKSNRNELRNLFQNCKLNIPASLSITLKENGETSRQPVQMPPVQNFIEILKIDEKAGTQTVTLKREDVKKVSSDPAKRSSDIQGQLLKSAAGAPAAPAGKSDQAKKKRKELTDKQEKDQQSFQKIFEESIKKTGTESECIAKPKPQEVEGETKKIQLSPPVQNQLIMTQKLQKVTLPKLNNQKTLKPPKKTNKSDTPGNQTLANLHSSSLGLNYTVSVGKQQRELMKPTCQNGFFSPRNGEAVLKVPSVVDPTKTSFKPSPISPRSSEAKSPRSDISSQRTPIPSPAPKKDPSVGLPFPMSSPRIFTPQSSPKPSSKASSPRPQSRNASPKPKASPTPPSSSAGSSSSGVPPLTANELLEKYNIQNLAQLSATMNYNAQAYLNSMSNKQMSAIHQSMLMKQIEAQNRQNWFNINPLPLLQYEKYLQTLNATKNQIMGNLKDN